MCRWSFDRWSPATPALAVRRLWLGALLLGMGTLGGCDTTGGGFAAYDQDPWRYDDLYRTGIYDHHHDVVVVRPDRPDRPNLPHRPRPLPARPGGGHGGRR